MDWDLKESIKEDVKVLGIILSVIFMICATALLIVLDHKRDVEELKVRSEYSWFLERSAKIELMAKYMNTLDVDDNKYEGAKEILELSVLEYNMKAVMLVSRDKWNCVVPYQYSVTELLYRGVARVENTNGRDSK